MRRRRCRVNLLPLSKHLPASAGSQSVPAGGVHGYRERGGSGRGCSQSTPGDQLRTLLGRLRGRDGWLHGAHGAFLRLWASQQYVLLSQAGQFAIVSYAGRLAIAILFLFCFVTYIGPHTTVYWFSSVCCFKTKRRCILEDNNTFALFYLEKNFCPLKRKFNMYRYCRFKPVKSILSFESTDVRTCYCI